MIRGLFIVFLLLSSLSFGQEAITYQGFDSTKHDEHAKFITGEWKINDLILDGLKNEYVLTPLGSYKDRSAYGDQFEIGSDSTFFTHYTAPCGNDCFTSSYGYYKMINDDYICFSLKRIHRDGDCKALDSTLNADLGFYRIFKQGDTVYLRKSDGNSQHDQERLNCHDLLVAKNRELSGFQTIDPMMKWSIMDQTTDIDSIAAFCMAENKIKHYEVLVDKRFDWVSGNMQLILVRIKGQLHYIVYRNEWQKKLKVALADVTFYNDVDEWVREIDQRKTLKVTTINDEFESSRNPDSLNTIAIYKEGSRIEKIIYTRYCYHKLWEVETYYFRNGEVFAIRTTTPSVWGDHFWFYVRDLNDVDNAVMKPHLRWSDRNMRDYYSYVTNRYKQFIEVVKKYESGEPMNPK